MVISGEVTTDLRSILR